MKYLFLFALLSICSFGEIASAQEFKQSVDGKLYDTNKEPVNAHGAGVLFYKGTYYLYGEIKKGTTWLVAGQSWEDYRVPAGGISCYSSKDLLHWRHEGTALQPTTGDPKSDIDTGNVIERPKVLYNKKTGKFVMWMHIDAKDYSYSQCGVAVSDNPAGPFRYISSVKPNGQMGRDMTLFQDTDNKAYLIYSSELNKTMQVCLLSDDYLQPTDHYSRILVDRQREAPALFKNHGKYYLITSDCTGWSANAASYAVAETIFGPYKELGNPCKGLGADTTYGTQSTYVLPIKKNVYLFMADRWNKTDLENSEYLWLKLKVDDDQVIIQHDQKQ
jgi:beta-xylosidase